MKTKEIIESINSNGGFDMEFITIGAKADNVTVFEFVRDVVKGLFPCHGNTANAVARYFTN